MDASVAFPIQNLAQFATAHMGLTYFCYAITCVAILSTLCCFAYAITILINIKNERPDEEE